MARWLVTAAMTVDASNGEAALRAAALALQAGTAAAGLESWRTIAPAMPLAPDAPGLLAESPICPVPRRLVVAEGAAPIIEQEPVRR